MASPADIASLLVDLKEELGITSPDADGEMYSRIEEAAAEYEERVRPFPGTYTTRMALPAILPRGTVTASASTNGSPLTTSLLLGGILTGYAYGLVDITFTTGPVPANHLAAIRADVAEYWTRTQRGGGPSRPSFGGDASFEPETPSRPVSMWPRIRALAPSVGIA